MVSIIYVYCLLLATTVLNDSTESLQAKLHVGSIKILLIGTCFAKVLINYACLQVPLNKMYMIYVAM